MPLFPFLEPTDSLEYTNRLINVTGLDDVLDRATGTSQSPTDYFTRQSRVRAPVPARSVREVLKWVIPERPIVSMYVNPSNIKFSEGKEIIETRTKGGFVIQYWGEKLMTLTISGSTASSGIEGINVLRDVYRSEQASMDPYALYLQSLAQKEQAQDFGGFLGDLLSSDLVPGISDQLDAVSFITGSRGSTSFKNAKFKPTLASLATGIEMHWFGEVYRGYFKTFDFDENADSLGLYKYNLSFSVTQKRGFRTNFLGWHRSPLYGNETARPYERPHSFNGTYFSPKNFASSSEAFQDISSSTSKNVNLKNKINNAKNLDIFGVTNNGLIP